MRAKELLKLTDQELYDVMIDNIDEEVDDFDDCETLETYSWAKRVFYTVVWFSSEVNNGGLCQYFVNSSRYTAPYVQDALHAIGAKKYLSLLNQFIEANAIDLNDLDSFIIEDIEEFEEQAERYPFDDFDDAFYALENEENNTFEELLGAFVRKHISEFASVDSD